MATAEAGTAAVSCVAETKVVVRAVPLKFTTEPLRKPVPFTVSVKPALPAGVVAGAMVLMVGAGSVTVKEAVLVPVPVGVVTAIGPLVAPAGTVKVMVVAFTTVKPVMATPFSVTAVAPVKSVPVTVTVTVPSARPLVGVKLAIVGAGVVTVKVAPAEVPPPGVGLVAVTAYVPTVATAEAGTRAVTCVAETRVVTRAVPLKVITVLLRKPVPFTVSVKPALPATAVLGTRPVIVGAVLGTITAKEAVLVAVPPGVVTAIGPLVAPVGTVKVMVVAFTTVKPVMATPFSVTAVAPVKSVPVTVTVTVPSARPLVGVKLAIVGAEAGAVGANETPRNPVLAAAVAIAVGRLASAGATLYPVLSRIE